MDEGFRPIEDPGDSYSPWDSGWQLAVAWGASLLAVLIGTGHLYLALKVTEWWISNH